jgi:Fe-Mn family superoxide dismutase
MKNFAHFVESKDHIVLEPLPYKDSDLKGVMSKETIDYHYHTLAAGYVKKYNEGKGDPKFNIAGAFLHNLFFPQLKRPVLNMETGVLYDKPEGVSLHLINEKFGSFEEFKKEFKDVAMKIQGSGWIYMSVKGEIEVIKNHEVKTDIALLIDWWEHAWALDYQADKEKYLDNIWKAIDWRVVNDRINNERPA